MRKLKIKEEELKLVIRGIQELNPRPGSQIAPQASEYVIPDVMVRKIKGDWRVELNLILPLNCALMTIMHPW